MQAQCTFADGETCASNSKLCTRIWKQEEHVRADGAQGSPGRGRGTTAGRARQPQAHPQGRCFSAVTQAHRRHRGKSAPEAEDSDGLRCRRQGPRCQPPNGCAVTVTYPCTRSARQLAGHP